MTIYSLLVFACVTSYDVPFGEEVKTCRWQGSSFHSTKDKCEAAGAEMIGKSVFSNTEGLFESSQCKSISVE
jgi:hypothetical protein